MSNCYTACMEYPAEAQKVKGDCTFHLAEDRDFHNLDDGVFVPVRVDNDEINLSLTLAWYF